MKYFIGILSAVALCAIAFFGFRYKTNLDTEYNLGVVYTYEIYHQASDVVGTHIGTSTIGVPMGAATSSVTSSYVSRIGKSKDIANYEIILTAVTSSADAWLTFSIEGSTDDYCWVSSSTAVDVSTGDINWFPIMDNLKDKVHATSLSGATSTLVWETPATGERENILLENLNYECLRLWVGGQSSTPYIGIATK